MPSMSLKAFAAHLTRSAGRMHRAEEKGLEAGVKLIQKEAKAEIGHYQGAVGPFPAWERLSPRTLYGGVSPTGFRYPGKVAEGYAPPDNPLLRTGELRDSIDIHVDGRKAKVFSEDPVAFWQEFGTRASPVHDPIPARSFIGRAAARKGKEAAKLVARHVFGPLTKGRLP